MKKVPPHFYRRGYATCNSARYHFLFSEFFLMNKFYCWRLILSGVCVCVYIVNKVWSTFHFCFRLSYFHPFFSISTSPNSFFPLGHSRNYLKGGTSPNRPTSTAFHVPTSTDNGFNSTKGENLFHTKPLWAGKGTWAFKYFSKIWKAAPFHALSTMSQR